MSVRASDTPHGATSPKGKAAEPAKPFLSEGVRVDLEQHGKATDPITGGVFAMDEKSGAVTHTDRAGNVTKL